MDGDADEQLTAAEQQLLDRLRRAAEVTARMANIQKTRSAGQADRDSELTALRRQIIELKEENQHLRELMATWKDRMGSLMTQINSASGSGKQG